MKKLRFFLARQLIINILNAGKKRCGNEPDNCLETVLGAGCGAGLLRLFCGGWPGEMHLEMHQNHKITISHNICFA